MGKSPSGPACLFRLRTSRARWVSDPVKRELAMLISERRWKAGVDPLPTRYNFCELFSQEINPINLPLYEALGRTSPTRENSDEWKTCGEFYYLSRSGESRTEARSWGELRPEWGNEWVSLQVGALNLDHHECWKVLKMLNNPFHTNG